MPKRILREVPTSSWAWEPAASPCMRPLPESPSERAPHHMRTRAAVPSVWVAASRLSPGVVHAGPRACLRLRCQLPLISKGSSSASALVKSPTYSYRTTSASSTGIPPHASASALAGSRAISRCAIVAARFSKSAASPPHPFQSRNRPAVLAIAPRLVGKLRRPSGVGTPAKSRSMRTKGSGTPPGGWSPVALTVAFARAPALRRKKTTSQ
mmetsp:Transcript_26936/g.72290  ORF Transcript_26936/g.72290 Transcript_26936/m.72290 type:complete len:211 (-) Transcript_26936:686-1318(-)